MTEAALLSQREAAQTLKCHIRTVSRYCKEGKLKGFRISRRKLLVSKQSLEELLAGSVVLPPPPEEK